MEIQITENKHEYDRILGAIFNTNLLDAVKTALEDRHKKLRQLHYSSTAYKHSIDEDIIDKDSIDQDTFCYVYNDHNDVDNI